jgi:hypothetical protein
VLFHHFVQRDELGDVDGAWVRRVGDGGVEVDDVDGTAEGREELDGQTVDDDEPVGG